MMAGGSDGSMPMSWLEAQNDNCGYIDIVVVVSIIISIVTIIIVIITIIIIVVIVINIIILSRG